MKTTEKGMTYFARVYQGRLIASGTCDEPSEAVASVNDGRIRTRAYSTINQQDASNKALSAYLALAAEQGLLTSYAQIDSVVPVASTL